jgi:predicted unusual protein kinase regulating ubiquinone biosynthesis (AarF/ABC1/UbiB family)
MDELRNIEMEEILDFLNEFRDLLYNLPFQVPENLIFLGRTVAILSGICTGLDPDFNVWQHIEPYARKIVASEASKSPQILVNEIGSLFQLILSLPKEIETTLEKVNRGGISVQTPDVKTLQLQLGRLALLLTLAILFSSTFLGAVELLIHEQNLFSAGLFVFSGILIIWIIILLFTNR